MAKKRKRNVPKKRSTNKKARSRNTRRQITKKERAKYNIIWGIVLCFIAFLFLLAIFGTDATFLNFISNGSKALIGNGFYAIPVFLIAAAISLFKSHGKPVRGRVILAVIAPLVVGILIHSFNGADHMLEASKFMEDGKAGIGGGLISGAIGAFLIESISRIATIILFILLTALITLASFNITIVAVIDWVKSLVERFPRGVDYDEEDEDEEEEDDEDKPVEEKKPRRRGRSRIDVPLDGEDVPVVDDPYELPERRVKTPAEVLAESAAAEPDEPYVMDEIDDEGIEDEVMDEPSDIAPPIDEGIEAPDTETQGEQQAIYHYPPVSLLAKPKETTNGESTQELAKKAKHLAETIRSFGIDIHILNIVRGPSVTRYEVQLDAGVKFSRLTGLSDDIALSLGAASVYIAPIPGKSAIGIEVPNATADIVYASEVIGSKEFTQKESSVAFAMGKDISGKCIVGDIEKLPHLLIAGTTGSGKSVCMNTLIVSLLYRSSPDEVRFIMIDPKMVELGTYNGIPHLLVPVVTDPKKANGALQWAVLEMMKRYNLFADVGVKNIQGYNQKVEEFGEGKKLPRIVIVIDELADLMVVAKKEVEDSILRLTQMARAAGMHLVVATQRPSTDVITGVIKSNIPSRIAFSVASKIESNIILGSAGAEKLIGRGDMLFNPIGATKPTRIQGCFISGDEVEAVVDYVKKSGVAEYSEEIIQQIEHQAEKKSSEDEAGGDEYGEFDELLDDAIDIVVGSGNASISFLQRRLKLGYARAARIVDQMEERGIVGPPQGAKAREILITKDQWNEIKMRQENL